MLVLSLLLRVTPDRPQLSRSLLVLFAILARPGCSTRSSEEADNETQSVRAGIMAFASSLFLSAGFSCSRAFDIGGQLAASSFFDSMEEDFEMSSGDPAHIVEHWCLSAQASVEDIDSSKHGDDDGGLFPMLDPSLYAAYSVINDVVFRY
mmetsp:Transcript_5620/g.8432  ORF Transcript_5620/g.8432 Transcript_5620/m.8432 type:complete len:150 (+) Transcript_5620:329-778(+)